MKRPSNWIVIFLMLAVCGGLFVLGYFFLKSDKIIEANSLKRQLRKEYYAHEYLKAYQVGKTLIDSLQVKDDAVSINYANAAFLSSNILTKVNNRGNIPGGKNEPDSTFIALGELAVMEYFKLTSSSDSKISSVASNQIGFSAIKKSELLDKTDSLIAEALKHFKDALKKDPENDSARYNYELLKKIAQYPETILAQTKSLIAEKRYKEAADLLDNAMKRDRRLQQHKDLLQRIRAVVGIDTLKMRRI